MPLQNRVTPLGELVAVPQRGALMGNRGRIHDAHRRIGRRHWERKAWITCVLEFKGRHRQVMAPNAYTELFFLDEATALAAGHRPCAECRRPDAERFKGLWLDANGDRLEGKSATMANMDTVLHGERVARDGCQRRWEARLSALPDGVMVILDDPRSAFLLWRQHLHRWSPGGYAGRASDSRDRTVTVLTPPSVTRVLANGYRPGVHPSAEAP